MSEPPLPNNYCPSCCKLNDGASNIEDPALVPGPGDLSVCIHCATILQFDEKLKSQVLTAEELFELEDDVRLEVMQMHRNVKEFLDGR